MHIEERLKKCAQVDTKGCRGCKYRGKGGCATRNAKESLEYINELKERRTGRERDQRIRLTNHEVGLLRVMRNECLSRDPVEPVKLVLSYGDAQRIARVFETVLTVATVMDGHRIEHQYTDVMTDDAFRHFSERMGSYVWGSRTHGPLEQDVPEHTEGECAGRAIASLLNNGARSTQIRIDREALRDALQATADRDVSDLEERLAREAYTPPVFARRYDPLGDLEGMIENAVWPRVSEVSGEEQVRSVRDSEEGASDRPRPEQTDEHVGG